MDPVVEKKIQERKVINQLLWSHDLCNYGELINTIHHTVKGDCKVVLTGKEFGGGYGIIYRTSYEGIYRIEELMIIESDDEVVLNRLSAESMHYFIDSDILRHYQSACRYDIEGGEGKVGLIWTTIKKDSQFVRHFIEKGAYKIQHRDGGEPAYIFISPSMQHERYMVNGKLHRVGGPATTCREFVRQSSLGIYMKVTDNYYVNGESHKEDGGPTGVITKYYYSGMTEVTETYSVQDKMHRKDGPALSHYTLHNGVKTLIQEEFYLDGVYATHGPGSRIDYKDGKHHTTSYFNAAGKLHREDGAAFIRTDDVWENYSAHYFKGKLHNDKGPAISGKTRTGAIIVEYFQKGKPFREDGPTSVYTDPTGKVVDNVTVRTSKRRDGTIMIVVCNNGSSHVKE